jgi:ABC-type multidrug transport system ATPase subunit
MPPNGAGKTTLLRILFGLVRSASRSVRLFDRSPSETEAADDH